MRVTASKRAGELVVGDQIILNNVTIFTVTKIEPSPLCGILAPVITGEWGGSRSGEGRIDLSDRRLQDHIFEVFTAK